MRIDKYLCDGSELSRTLAHRAIKQGRVQINNAVVSKFSIHVTDADLVTLDNTPISQTGQRYYMLHKPTAYVCANSDNDHPVVLDLLNEINKDRLQICGRLDIDTTGLVLISDDGKWNHRVTSPNQDKTKRYQVNLAEVLETEAIKQLSEGIVLKGEIKPCRPAEIEHTGSHSIILSISEGRYHQVKRMLAAVGNHVTGLHRISIGGIELDPELPPGEYRALTPKELEQL